MSGVVRVFIVLFLFSMKPRVPILAHEIPKCLLISLKKCATEDFPLVPVTAIKFLGFFLNFFNNILRKYFLRSFLRIEFLQFKLISENIILGFFFYNFF